MWGQVLKAVLPKMCAVCCLAHSSQATRCDVNINPTQSIAYTLSQAIKISVSLWQACPLHSNIWEWLPVQSSVVAMCTICRNICILPHNVLTFCVVVKVNSPPLVSLITYRVVFYNGEGVLLFDVQRGVLYITQKRQGLKVSLYRPLQYSLIKHR